MYQPKELKPVFVFNIFGRMGSTLMMQLLATSPQIAFDRTYPFEVHYLTYLLQWSRLLDSPPNNKWGRKEHFDQGAHLIGSFPHSQATYWDGKEFFKNSFGNIWREFSKSVIAKKKSSMEDPIIYYAEKVPFWLPEYMTQLMPYKAILLMRDPRDIFLSVTAFDIKRGYSGFLRQPDDDDWSYAKKLVTRYRERIKLFYQEQEKEHNIVIKYEDLVFNLQSESDRLSQWLGVVLQPNLAENQSKDFAFHMTSATPFESVRRWKRELSSELNDFFVSELKADLEYFGYLT